MAKTKNLTAIARALDQISWQWLSDNHPELIEAIEVEVGRGATPVDVRRFVMQYTDRFELALRCQQAANWVEQIAGES
jgi:hypothetical protein